MALSKPLLPPLLLGLNEEGGEVEGLARGGTEGLSTATTPPLRPLPSFLVLTGPGVEVGHAGPAGWLTLAV